MRLRLRNVDCAQPPLGTRLGKAWATSRGGRRDSGTYAHFTSSSQIHALGARPFFTRVVLSQGSRLEHVCTLRHLIRSLKRRGARSCDDDVKGRRTQAFPSVYSLGPRPFFGRKNGLVQSVHACTKNSVK